MPFYEWTCDNGHVTERFLSIQTYENHKEDSCLTCGLPLHRVMAPAVVDMVGWCQHNTRKDAVTDNDYRSAPGNMR